MINRRRDWSTQLSRRLFRLAFSLISVLPAAGFVIAQDTPQTISDAARTYLGQALDLIQNRALNRDSIDWTQVRRDTFARAPSAQTTFDTYPAIAYALTQMKEHHSFLRLPDSLSYAQKQAITLQMTKMSGSQEPNWNSLSPFSPSKLSAGMLRRLTALSRAHSRRPPARRVIPQCGRVPGFPL
jgi:hypothetical protein